MAASCVLALVRGDALRAVLNNGKKRMATQNVETIRPFRIDVPEEDLVELRGRIAATQLPDTLPSRS